MARTVCVKCGAVNSIQVEQVSRIQAGGEFDWYVGEASRCQFSCTECPFSDSDDPSEVFRVEGS